MKGFEPPETPWTDETGFIEQFLSETAEILGQIDRPTLASMIHILAETKATGGRLFILGVGGSAANASHAVNDFRKIAGLEAFAPTDNVAELTARINDEGWESAYARWLQGSRLNSNDAVLVLSVGGGNYAKNISRNLIQALQFARRIGASILGIVGRDGGYTARVADACVVVPTVNAQHVTPHSEAFQAILWHLIVSHPILQAVPAKWEIVA